MLPGLASLPPEGVHLHMASMQVYYFMLLADQLQSTSWAQNAAPARVCKQAGGGMPACCWAAFAGDLWREPWHKANKVTKPRVATIANCVQVRANGRLGGYKSLFQNIT
jgi:hypothetical protein